MVSKKVIKKDLTQMIIVDRQNMINKRNDGYITFSMDYVLVARLSDKARADKRQILINVIKAHYLTNDMNACQKNLIAGGNLGKDWYKDNGINQSFRDNLSELYGQPTTEDDYQLLYTDPYHNFKYRNPTETESKMIVEEFDDELLGDFEELTINTLAEALFLDFDSYPSPNGDSNMIMSHDVYRILKKQSFMTVSSSLYIYDAFGES